MCYNVVCIQQTVLDLLEQGNNMNIIVDVLISQQVVDWEIDLPMMQLDGAFLTMVQWATYLLIQSADQKHFKFFRKLCIKLTTEHMKLPKEFNNNLLKNLGVHNKNFTDQ